MVPEQQQPHHPITIDFLGLGNASTGDQAQDDCHREAQCFPRSSDMKFTGVNSNVCDKGLLTDQNVALRHAIEGRYWEGVLQSQGFAYPTRQWSQMPYHHGATGGPQQTRDLQYAKESGSQLTIFYNGNVNVYNDVSVETVEAIVRMAAIGKPFPASSVVPNEVVGASQGFAQHARFGENMYLNCQVGQTHVEADQTSQNCPPAYNKPFDCPTPSSASSPLPLVPRALPLARKASLARFLEKRRERMQMMAPYMKQQQPVHVQFPCTTTGAVFARIHEEFSKKQPMLSSGL